MGGADRLDEHALEELIHRTVVDITRQIAKIDLRLCSQDPDPANELCTLHTTIDLSLIHISEPTRQAEISYAVFCLKKKKKNKKKKKRI